MREKKRGAVSKLCACMLALLLILAPAVSALSPDELKQLLQEHYLEKVSDAVMQEDTVDGILKVLDDKYTTYMTAKEYQELIDSMADQEIGGIGVSVILNEQGLGIVEVFAGSPAQTLGLKAGDIIIAVDGKSAVGQSSEIVTSWLRGVPGTMVEITVLHTDGRQVRYQATRQKVVLPSTTSELINGHLGYLNCKAFGPQTQQHFLDAMKAYPAASIWLVDLRSNFGGELDATAQTLGTFLGKRGIVYLKNGKDQYMLYTSRQDSMTIKPTIILTSGYTASAAEVFSAVMRDTSGGLLIGEKTYGKGVAQVILDQNTNPDIFHDGDAAKITAYRYYTKDGGNTADKMGVLPHLLVDAVDAGDIALLLSEKEPAVSDTSNYLRLHLGDWRWYLNLTEATSEENLPYFQELLEAIPPNTTMKQGTKTGEWIDVSVSSLVKTYGITGYVSRNLTDLAGRADADPINTLATYNIVHGDQSRQYHPDASMSRAELCALLVQAFGLSTTRKDTNFTDVDSKAWYAEEVQAVVSAGLMQGMGDGKFLPQGTVTEEQLITVLARSASNLNTYLYETSKTFAASQAHVPAGYASWSQPWVWLLSDSQKNLFGKPINLLHAAPETIKPQASATRGEAAVVLYNILHFVGVLPT